MFPKSTQLTWRTDGKLPISVLIMLLQLQFRAVGFGIPAALGARKLHCRASTAHPICVSIHHHRSQKIKRHKLWFCKLRCKHAGWLKPVTMRACIATHLLGSSQSCESETVAQNTAMAVWCKVELEISHHGYNYRFPEPNTCSLNRAGWPSTQIHIGIGA